jgi:hypothetical protein
VKPEARRNPSGVGPQAATIEHDLQARVKWITARACQLLQADLMNPSDSDCLCPVCDRPMRLAAVLRPTPREETLVLQCRACGVSTTKTVEAKAAVIGLG